MASLRNLPLERKLTLISLVTSCVALLLTGGIVVVYEYVNTRRALVEEVWITARMVADNSAAALTFDDPESAAQTLRSLSADPHIAAAVIYGANGQPFSIFQNSGTPPPNRAEQRNLHRFNRNSLEVFCDISAGGENIGTVYLQHDLRELGENLHRSVCLMLAAMAAVSLVAYLLSRRLQRLVAGPIIDLGRVVRDVALYKDFSVRAVKQGDDEVGRLIDGFNEMLGQIQARDLALQSAQDDLEKRVVERTAELAGSVSLLNATLDSTTDGILAVQLTRQVTCFNSQFVSMWGVPPDVLEKRQGAALVDFIASKVKNPEYYRSRIESLSATVGIEVSETLELVDGRFFERHVRPQQLDGRVVGVVISYRDISIPRRAAAALRKEQELLAALFENVADGIVSCDASGVLTLFNRASREFHGLPAVPIPAEQWAEHYDLYLPDGETRMTRDQTPLYRALTEGSVRDIEVVIAPRHLAPRRVVANGQAFFDSTGRKAGAVVALHDITARRRDEEELRESHEKFRQLADNITDAFWIRSPDLTALHYISAGYAATWGRSTEALCADPRLWTETIVPEDRERAIAALCALSGSESEVSVEYRIHRPDGTIRWIHDRGFQARDVAGRLVRLTGIASDITERKRAEAELDNVHQQLLETSRHAGMAEVATGVLHNVGNVLNSVNISATLVAEGIKKSKVGNLGRVVDLLDRHAGNLVDFLNHDSQGKNVPEFLRQLHERLSGEQRVALIEVESLRQNIDHIKDIVEMQQEYARFTGVTEVLNVNDLVEDCLRMNAAALARHHVAVTRDYQETPPITIEKHKALQILVNLLRNAKDACDASGRSDKQILVRVQYADRRVSIFVVDNGNGIPPENLLLIFNHGFTTRKDGHGFGLHSAALTAAELGGTLRAHSDGPGRGATFTLELPVERRSP